MMLNTFYYTKDNGWSVQELPQLDSINTLVYLFCDPKFIDDQKPILDLMKQYPNSNIIGCSSSGEILGPSIKDGAIVVAIVKFDKTDIKISAVDLDDGGDSFNVGKKIVNDLDAPNIKGIFVLSEGLNVNGSELTKGLNTINKDDVIITGGLAGDGDRFQRTWIVSSNQIKSKSVVAVGFYGDYIRIGHGSKGGWDIFGPERFITRSSGNVLYELDHKPALTLYKEYLGEKAKQLPASGLLYPLSIRKDKNDSNSLVRTILAIDDNNHSLTFAGDVPVGHLARLMRANFDRLITGAKQAGEEALIPNEVSDKYPILLIGISCVGRRLLLGERTEEETESIVNLFPKSTEFVGFYSYGEISPLTKGSCELHNQTMTLTSIYEEVDD